MKHRINYTLLISFFISMLFILCNLYSKYSFNKNEAKDIVIKFYKNLDKSEFIQEIYPDFYKIGSVIKIDNKYKIKKLIKNKNGQFQVYIECSNNEQKHFFISFIIEKKDGKTIIKSSKGLSIKLYDGTFNKGIKEGVFLNNFTDVEIGNALKDKEVSKEMIYWYN